MHLFEVFKDDARFHELTDSLDSVNDLHPLKLRSVAIKVYLGLCPLIRIPDF